MLKSTPVSGTKLTVGINAFEKKNIIMEMSKRKRGKRQEKNTLSWKCQQEQQQKEERKNIIMEMSPNTNMSRLLVSVLTVYCLCVYLIEMYLSHREAD